MMNFSSSNRRIERLAFSKDDVAKWREKDETHGNWPVVYVLDDDARDEKGKKKKLRDVYVGESHNAASRLRQHLETKSKGHLKKIRVIFDESFNKSVCLDLESYLIKMLAGDGANQVLNRNNGVIESRYYQREMYRESFRNIFLQLKTEGMFTRNIPEIENSSLFKLSPFKALTEDQANSVEEIVRGLLEDAKGNSERTIVIQGDPGTGKTVVAIYIIKLLLDIKTFTSLDDLDADARFSEFFTIANQDILQGLTRIGLVVPQQALRASVQDVFRKTKGLDPKMVMTAFEVGKAREKFDLLLVDETHRLSQRANQVMGTLNRDFKTITETLYGHDDKTKTQLDWIQTQSRHRIFFLDTKQGIRPADLPRVLLTKLVADSRASKRHFLLRTQMRVQAGSNFVSRVRWILDPDPDGRPPDGAGNLGAYNFALFDDFNRMRNEIIRHDAEVGLSRLVAGFAWEWRSKEVKKDGKRVRRGSFDIEIEGTKLCWNGNKEVDWISSSNALEEVGSIHTVQGYDLNYVGVIIGLDLRFDPTEQRLFIDRDSYFDKKGKENSKALGRTVSDADLLRFITQIYGVLMTRGIRGTYVYVCDPGLREYLRGFIPTRS